VRWVRGGRSGRDAGEEGRTLGRQTGSGGGRWEVGEAGEESRTWEKWVTWAKDVGEVGGTWARWEGGG